MDPAQDKTEARRAAFARRKAARGSLGPAPEAASAALLEALAPAVAARAVIAGYLPIRTEIDPRPVMARLHAAGLTVCVPVVEGEARPLIFRTWTPDAALVPGPFGAFVPETGDPAIPAALIVPLAAFDSQGFRLGYGGGFYDRTLEGLRAAGSTLAVGFAYAAQETDTLPREAVDQPLDRVATEKGLRRFD